MSDDKTIGVHGWCATFCAQVGVDGEPNNGRAVDEHGSWCRSLSLAADGITPTGERLTAYVEAISNYWHGRYPQSEVTLHNALTRRVALSLGDGLDPQLVLTPGEARQLAAGLIHFADVASNIDAPAPRWSH